MVLPIFACPVQYSDHLVRYLLVNVEEDSELYRSVVSCGLLRFPLYNEIPYVQEVVTHQKKYFNIFASKS